MARTTEKRGKWNTNTVWPGIWRETLKNVEKGKGTLQDLDHGEKTENQWKMRNTNSQT